MTEKNDDRVKTYDDVTVNDAESFDCKFNWWTAEEVVICECGMMRLRVFDNRGMRRDN